MPITFTVTVDDTSGVDTAYLLTGATRLNITSAGSGPDSANYSFVLQDGTYYPELRVVYSGYNFEPQPGGTRGQVTSAVLYSRATPDLPLDPLAHLSIDFGDSGETYALVPSIQGVTPDTLMNFYKFFGVAFRAIGNAGSDRLHGSGYADTIDGRGGADVMAGHGGNDIYFVDNVGDLVFELPDDGTDTIAASRSYALGVGTSVEVLRTTNTAGTAAINLTGNELAQSILGTAGANRLDGGGGADAMRGFGGNDLYYVDNAGDLIFEAAGQGSDTVAVWTSYTLRAGQSIELLQTTNSGGTGAISLAGNEIAQVVKGNNGANVIYGKGGSDVLYGYGGADTFVFDTAPGAANRDTIMDFSHAADTIRLDKTFFAGLTVGNLAATAFKDIGVAGAVVDSNDRILYNSDTGALFYDSNGSGAGGAVQFGTLFGHPNDINHLDFVIVA